MKDSGIPWIGEIPEGWEIVYGKKIYLANDGGVWGEDSDGIDDTIVLRSTEQDIEGRLIIEEPARRKLTNKEFESSKLKEGDLIITKSSGSPSHIGKTSLITESVAKLNCCYSNFIQRLRVNGNPLFYWFLLNSVVVKKQFEYLSTTTTGINNINSKTLDSLLFPIPSFDEQQRIAEFLDRKCAEVDDMIGLQEKIIEELNAYKQSVITEAVTKGLNPAAPMRDSGIEWIGSIPEHWEVEQFRRLFDIKKIIANELGYDVLSVTQGGLKVKDISTNEGQMAQDYSKYQLVGIDDYVMNHMDLLTGFVDCSKQIGVTSPDYRVFKAKHKSDISLPFFLRIFQTCYKLRIFYHLGQGVAGMGRWRLPAEQLKLFLLPIPPLAEQQAIADYLDEKCADIDSLIQTKQSKIDSLKEYKKSIIYEYVTGKREVE
jgi:type I restriction enzyme S subunit